MTNYQMPTLTQYPQNTAPQPMQTNPQNNIVWVQGIEGAKAHVIPSNSVVSLWDSESQTIYIKMTDQAGIPQPLKILDYTERAPEPVPDTNFVTEERLSEILDEKLSALTAALSNNRKGGYNKNGKPSIQ